MRRFQLAHSGYEVDLDSLQAVSPVKRGYERSPVDRNHPNPCFFFELLLSLGGEIVIEFPFSAYYVLMSQREREQAAKVAHDKAHEDRDAIMEVWGKEQPFG